MDCHLEAFEIRACSWGPVTPVAGEQILAGIREKRLVPAVVDLESTEVPAAAAVVVAVEVLGLDMAHNLLTSSVVADRGHHPAVAFRGVVAEHQPGS